MIEDSSGNRFASTAYFAKPGFVGVEFSGGKQPGWNLLGGKLPVTKKERCIYLFKV